MEAGLGGAGGEEGVGVGKGGLQGERRGALEGEVGDGLLDDQTALFYPPPLLYLSL